MKLSEYDIGFILTCIGTGLVCNAVDHAFPSHTLTIYGIGICFASFVSYLIGVIETLERAGELVHDFINKREET